MALTKSQIDFLFAFTTKKYVHWYDLQCEIVDHLAEKIEEEMSIDKKLSFERALTRVYDGFGIFGFSKIVQERGNQMHRQYKKMWWKAFVNEFNWPNIMRSLCILAILYFGFSYFPAKWVFASFGGVSVAFAIKDIIDYRKYSSANKKLMMLELVPSFNLWSWMLLQFVYQKALFSFWDEDGFSSKGFPYLYLALVFLFTITYFAYKKVSAQVITKAKAYYPEAFANS